MVANISAGPRITGVGNYCEPLLAKPIIIDAKDPLHLLLHRPAELVVAQSIIDAATTIRRALRRRTPQGIAVDDVRRARRGDKGLSLRLEGAREYLKRDDLVVDGSDLTVAGQRGGRDKSATVDALPTLASHVDESSRQPLYEAHQFRSRHPSWLRVELP